MAQPSEIYTIVAFADPRDNLAPWTIGGGDYHTTNQRFTDFENAGSELDWAQAVRIELRTHMLNRATQRWTSHTVRTYNKPA